MSEAVHWPPPSRFSEPVLTLVRATDAAEASAWVNAFAVGRAARSIYRLTG